MLRWLYDKTLEMASKPYAEWGLAGVSFSESSFFPIPPDILLIPMVLAERLKAWRYAIVCTIASVLGGLFGYFIGAVLFQQVALPILELYGYADKFETFRQNYVEWGAWIVFIAGVTPFPYKVITIASGAAALNLPVFIIASVIARGLRFFIVAGLMYWFGPPVQGFIEKRLGLVFTVFCVCLVGGFVAIRYLH